ncbi:MAG: TPM domain-containing protein [Gammaproteobacteria bacterium]|nr:TPM domain-containing protein [Gammaproteobacteria bacterium]
MIEITQTDHDKITQAVLEAEKHTTGEIVPMIVAQSDDYSGARWRLAVTGALFAGFLAYFFLGDYDPVWILYAQIPGLYLGYALGNVGAILRPFMLSDKIDEEVNQRALQAFYEHNLHHTKDHTAILIMVSLLEHRVEILADAGINAKVPKDTWQTIVNDMITAIKTKDLSEGICVAVRECADILAKDFPGQHDNPDELSNKLIVEE